ncbi:cytochrome d ubiquinol oxidase subunit II [Planctomicrobium sp. SH661]|uniref:cytochrome d ubiquinol oxidase subunit II n=1 Tax=Planctomicrobium sp. SH661 TaxID=3448124 RepID=UPI003F5B7446
METTWFVIVWGMLAIYAVLDGFDFGVGILHFFVAKSDAERRTVLSSIGPIWDGNEVWLVAAGGVLFATFPRMYAVTFSGFYMALMIVLWLLILRGVAIEFRVHQENLLWRQFWDGIFTVASALLALVIGTTLGNLVRGVPLNEKGLSGMPLFTNFLPDGNVGVFDWYTLLVGLFTLMALAAHGALFLIWRTTGPVQSRSRTCAYQCWRGTLVLWIAVTAATAWLRPEVFGNLIARPWSLILVVLALGGFGAIRYALNHHKELPAFAASCVFLLSLLSTIVVATYPVWLRSTVDSAFHLTISNTSASEFGLKTAIGWWMLGISLAIGYFVFLFYSIRRKVESEDYGSLPSSEAPGQLQ